MPRGGRRASPMRSSPAPSRHPPAPAAQPAHHPPPPPPAGRQGPGLFGQMAATAGGVAIGSAVGHTLGAALMGGGGGGHEAAPAQVDQGVPQQQQMQQPQQRPCEFELRQFLDCTQQQGDLTMCEGFNQALKDCRVRYGV